MSAEFKREERYVVFKVSDVVEHLTTTDALHLAILHEIQRVGRKEAGKPELECVVVESDWPEYEPTWQAIEARVTGAQPEPSVPMDVIADYLVSISAHLARRDDAKAQAEIGELLKMIAPAPKPAQSVPDGWKLMPIEPTQEMINHVIHERLGAFVAGKDHTFIDIYKAMLAAAPETKP